MILFINPYESKFGPAVHAGDFIKFVKNNKSIEVSVATFDSKNMDGLMLQTNNRFFTLLYSIFFLLPRQSAKYFNFRNLATLKKFIKKRKCKRVYFFGFSHLSFFSTFIKHDFKVITSPDAQSLRYKNILKFYNFKTLFQFLLYKFLEWRTLKTFKLVHVVAEKDYNYLKLKNSIYLPFHLSVESLCSIKKRFGTMMIISQIDIKILKQYLEMITSLDEINEIVVLDYSNNLKNKINFNNKVKFVDWVENYESYVSKFHFLLAVDPVQSTGMLTRTTQNIYSGNIVLGNKIAFRNINNNNQFDDCIFENLQELKFKIKDIIKSQKLRSSQFQIDYLNEFMNFNKIMTKQYNFLIKEI